MTDQELATALGEGLSTSQIAARHGISRQAVNLRRKRLTTSAGIVAVVAPEPARRMASAQISLQEELVASLTRVKLLFDACDTWLRDADNPEVYDLGPRADEVTVTYWDMSGDTDDEGREKMAKCKAKLSTLLKRIDDGGILTMGAETKYADPRKLILATAKELRGTVGQAAELARLLSDLRQMEAFRQAILDEISKVSPDIAERISQAVRRILVLHAAADGPGPVPTGGTAGRMDRGAA